MLVDLDLLTKADQIHDFIRDELPRARESVVVATAPFKYVTFEGSDDKLPFARIIDDLVQRGVLVSLICAASPSRTALRSLMEHPSAAQHLRIRICARMHYKAVIIDGTLMYLGSANLTAAGMGVRDPGKRNFEWGAVTRAPRMICWVLGELTEVWTESACRTCHVRTRRKCFLEHEKCVGGF